MRYGFKEYKPTQLIKNHLNIGGENPDGEKIEVSNLYFLRGGRPWTGVMGEYHFSRDSRKNWYRELCKMKAGGISIVSTYLIWIYHEEEEGHFDFSGDLDIREFLCECKKTGLDVVLRIGPWVHGEVRNGGFPDWLLQKPYKLRSNDAGYMEQAEVWYQKIYEQVRGFFYKDGGNIVAVQLENELVDNAEHLLALKKSAVKAGLIAPIYTVTGWNSVSGARIPVEEVVPVFGAYADSPWEPGSGPLPLSRHYFFNKMRNDTAIGADLIPSEEKKGWQLPYEKYPFATCELGGGIQATHHRRPLISPMDTYALSLVKLGSGNNLTGYYMYHGGTNKTGRLSTFQESKDTGYPNDYPILSYDFQAPVSEYGEIRPQYRLLNMLHMFIHSFGEMLAPMETVEAELPTNYKDMEALRYAMRTDGKSGFVFINHHQRNFALKNIYGAVIDTGVTQFPPLDIKGDNSFFMPFQMPVGGEVLKYATAQPLCKLGSAYFFTAIEGINPQYAFEEGKIVFTEAGMMFEEKGVKIITLTWDQAQYARILSGRLYIGRGCDLYEYGGAITAAQEGDFSYDYWDGDKFVTKEVLRKYSPAEFGMVPVSEPFVPKYEEELNIGGRRSRQWFRISVSSPQGFAEIAYCGDTAQIYADGELAADEYYLGRPWRVPAKLLYGKECYLVVAEKQMDY